MRFPAFLLFLLLTSATAYSQQYSLRFVDTKTDASFRGLSVADEHAIWVSGSKGWVGRSVNGGVDWSFSQVQGYENCDFRTLYAFDSSNAIIANAGSPAYILRTGDGGASWQRVYENTDSAAFFDGMDFWDKKRGIIHGDPIGGRMLLLYTKDGGRSWKERNSPKMNKGEASFAASGTSISCVWDRAVVIATGGKTSRLFLSLNRGRSWHSIPTPMLAGTESTGIYSVMKGYTISHWLIAGGDYRRDTLSTANFFYTWNKGKKWLAPASTTRGYRECLAQICDQRPAKKCQTLTMFALGPSGIDISTDDGVNWKPLSDEKGFHVIKPSWDHNLMFLAGGNGKLAIMKTTP
ncbi:WD40/YVTN/BNR-like repeat-containing protein [Polluticoccus soli]|uniref:WD40/YVTN/BNR-like repeat-containing protein n=1 Tax=Polluticoccus soli TaxID=3034150 RepID=UPI0023E350CA|nr:YCF48-related protein [Flavipsychrobacter sp. JY13-12]